jgi:hypothetical protein
MRITGLVSWQMLDNGLGLRRLSFLSFISAVVFYSRIGELILITHCLSAGRMCLTWWGGPQLECGVAVGQDGGQHMAHSFTHPAIIAASFLETMTFPDRPSFGILLIKKE